MMFGFGKRPAGATAVQPVLSAKSTPVMGFSLSGLLTWLGWGTTASGVDINETSALMTPAVMASVRAISEGLAQMPGMVKRRTYTKGGLPRMVPDPSHWAVPLLTQKPNEFQTAHEFVEGMIFHAVLGRGGLAIKNVIRGKVVELLPVPSNAWTVEQRPDYSLLFRVDYADKTHDYFDRRQVLFVRGPSWNNIEGLPAIQMAREAIGLSVALERQQATLAGNGGKPSGILSFKKPLTPDSKEKLRATWASQFGARGEGGIAVLDTDASFAPMTMTSVDAQFLETRGLQIEEIARAFRVQPFMIGKTDRVPFNTAEQIARLHVVHTLGPWISRWEDAIARDILNFEAVWDLDEGELLRGDWEVMGKYLATGLGAGGQKPFLTQDEARVMVGLNPLETAESSDLGQGAMAALPAPAGKAADPSLLDVAQQMTETKGADDAA